MTLKRAFKPRASMQLIEKLPFGRQLARRLYNRLFMHLAPKRTATTFFGARMHLDTRDFLQATIHHFGTWEPNVSSALQKLVRPGDTAVDLGANVGYYTLLLAHAVGADGWVVGVEAHGGFAEDVARNLRLNGLQNVRIVRVAVAEAEGEAVVHEGPRSNGGSTTIRARRGLRPSFTVPARPLLAILRPGEIARTSLIKIDIEGAEGPVLREIVANLALFPERLAIAVEVNPEDDPGWPDLFESLLAAGFRAARLRNDYDWERIREEAAAPPEPVTSLPPSVADILFYRGQDLPA